MGQQVVALSFPASSLDHRAFLADLAGACMVLAAAVVLEVQVDQAVRSVLVGLDVLVVRAAA